jgi:UDP-N-acetylglucosamine/UDP-N-acetylgalactosamine diphosphorylase
MPNVPPDLIHRLRSHGQEHLLFGWDRLDDRQRADLVDQLAGIDFETVARLFSKPDEASIVPSADRLAPIPSETDQSIDATSTQFGHEALARGELAVLLVAGGQGTRLGFDKPKGMFPIGPVSNRTLFQIHADKVFALSRRYGRTVPFLIMTSPATHTDSEGYFREHGFFGLDESNVHFFQQGSMPAVDIATGRLLLEAPGRVFTSPNGHGGTLIALSAPEFSCPP